MANTAKITIKFQQEYLETTILYDIATPLRSKCRKCRKQYGEPPEGAPYNTFEGVDCVIDAETMLEVELNDELEAKIKSAALRDDFFKPICNVCPCLPEVDTLNF